MEQNIKSRIWKLVTHTLTEKTIMVDKIDPDPIPVIDPYEIIKGYREGLDGADLQNDKKEFF